MTLLLLACVAPDEGPLVRRAGVPDRGDDTALDTAAPVDSGAFDSADTGPADPGPSDTGAEPPEEPSGNPEACWLGPGRDWTTCVPTVDASSGWGSDYAYPAPYDGSAQYAAPARFVDLDALDPDLAIAPNFVLSEYMEAWKGRWGVLQDHHVEVLQGMRDALGAPLVITSGYRSPGYNAGVGGVEYSRHQYGDGSDLDASGWSVEELGALCEDFGADYVGLYEDGHTHCDWRNTSLDPAFFDTGRAAREVVPLPVHGARLERDGDAWTAPATGFDEGEPHRRWTAWDAMGVVLAEGTGRRFVPPPGAARVRVVVGGRVTVER